MTVGTCVSAHPLEHALSAYHEKLPHGAGLIMISKAYYSFFINKHVCDDRFVEMAKLMGMEDASKPEDFITMLGNCSVPSQLRCKIHENRLRRWDFAHLNHVLTPSAVNASGCTEQLRILSK